MNTPICDFVKKYIKSKAYRLHVPGHKGKGYFGVEKFDITEISGADSLYNANGIIKQSEENTSTLFNCYTFYSTEGSSLSIRAMVYLVDQYAKESGKKVKILSTRNVHKSFLSAAALLKAEVDWYFEEQNENSNSSYISQSITSDNLDHYLSSLKIKPTAFYITSPDYLGRLADIKSIANICHKHGVLLMVDCAHGSYLKFISPSLFPIDLGADICCSSAHKTLPVLTGGAYLHISKTAPNILKNNAKKALSTFGSTSPSYLILQSLDYANLYLYNNYKGRLNSFANKVNNLKNKLQNFGYTICSEEPLKLTLLPKNMGYTGIELSEILSKNKVVAEFFDQDAVVLMLTPENCKKTLKKLEKLLLSIKIKSPIETKPPKIALCEKALSISKSSLSNTEIILVKESLGRIYAESNIPCPPAVPIIMCGEIINEKTIEVFNYYNITTCEVVKN